VAGMDNTDTTPPTYEEVAARLRAEYAAHTPAQRASLGEAPSDTLIACEWNRQLCNSHTDEEVREGAERMRARIEAIRAARAAAAARVEAETLRILTNADIHEPHSQLAALRG